MKKIESNTILIILLMSALNWQCGTSSKEKKMDTPDAQYIYQVKPSTEPPEINSEWNREIWNESSALVLSNYMGDKPSHFPETMVKLRYDKDNIYVIFKVSDRYVKAVAKETNGKVWQDSCVEFFFSPGPDIERGYFNFEANCKGVFLFEYHVNDGDTKGFVSSDDYKKVKITHSLVKDVTREFTEPLKWTIEYSIPISILSKIYESRCAETGSKLEG